ncbi:Retinol dehydrogenase 12 [Ceratobasidium sp. UAMH 11750]|nr:Retinol dehydrogenase 12 [Ceratobasidium sp. UAMH 11750]
MPYSEYDHFPWTSAALGLLSSARTHLLDCPLAALYPRMRRPQVDLSGKMAIVTGANSGIGYEIALALAGMGARVVMACRNAERGEDARHAIVKETGNNALELELLDCGSFSSVRSFLERWEQREDKTVDILMNNAGCISGKMTKTVDGFEQTYQTNHLSHVLLTHTLLNRGHLSSHARIVSSSSFGFFVSSPLNESTVDAGDIMQKYSIGTQLPHHAMMEAYCRTKAAQAVWTMVLQRRLSQEERWKHVVVQSCHPGFILSPIWTQLEGHGSSQDKMAKFLNGWVNLSGISNKEGAVVPVWVATADEPAKPELRGMYWDRMAWKWVPAWSLETTRQEMLWKRWCEDAGAILN